MNWYNCQACKELRPFFIAILSHKDDRSINIHRCWKFECSLLLIDTIQIKNWIDSLKVTTAAKIHYKWIRIKYVTTCWCIGIHTQTPRYIDKEHRETVLYQFILSLINEIFSLFRKFRLLINVSSLFVGQSTNNELSFSWSFYLINENVKQKQLYFRWIHECV